MTQQTIAERWAASLALFTDAQNCWLAVPDTASNDAKMDAASAAYEALENVLCCPTPDAAALLVKLRLMWPDLEKPDATQIPGARLVVWSSIKTLPIGSQRSSRLHSALAIWSPASSRAQIRCSRPGVHALTMAARILRSIARSSGGDETCIRDCIA